MELKLLQHSRNLRKNAMILALLHNCHESKNDVRNALAAQIRKLEPKNYLETFKNKNLSLSTATTRRRSYTERQSRTRSTSCMIPKSRESISGLRIVLGRLISEIIAFLRFEGKRTCRNRPLWILSLSSLPPLSRFRLPRF